MSDAKWYEVGTIVKINSCIPAWEGTIVKIVFTYGKDTEEYEALGYDYRVESVLVKDPYGNLCQLNVKEDEIESLE